MSCNKKGAGDRKGLASCLLSPIKESQMRWFHRASLEAIIQPLTRPVLPSLTEFFHVPALECFPTTPCPCPNHTTVVLNIFVNVGHFQLLPPASLPNGFRPLEPALPVYVARGRNQGLDVLHAPYLSPCLTGSGGSIPQLSCSVAGITEVCPILPTRDSQRDCSLVAHSDKWLDNTPFAGYLPCSVCLTPLSYWHVLESCPK